MVRKRTAGVAKPNGSRGSRLARWLQDNKMSQSVLARKVGVVPSALSMIVRQQRTPRTDLLKKLIAATGLSAESILGLGRRR